MNAMRLMQRLRAAEDKFEKDVAAILADASTDQVNAAAALVGQKRKYRKMPKAKKAKQARGGRKNVTVENGKTIQDYARAVLLKHGSKMRLTEIVAAMKKRGWTTTSKNPTAMLSVTLRKLGGALNIRSKGNGYYVATA